MECQQGFFRGSDIPIYIYIKYTFWSQPSPNCITKLQQTTLAQWHVRISGFSGNEKKSFLSWLRRMLHVFGGWGFWSFTKNILPRIMAHGYT